MALLPDAYVLGPIELRRWRLGDAPALVEAVAASIEQLRPWMPWAQEVPTAEDTAGVLAGFDASFDAGETFAYGMFEPAGEVVGGCGLHLRGDPRTAEIGYWVRTDRHRQGYATAAAGALTTAAFTIDGIERVHIRVALANVNSAGVPSKLGYRLDGEVELDGAAPGHDGNGLLWVMERGRWA